MDHEVFISYAEKDRKIADLAISGLENAGIRCWVSHRDAAPGSEWASSIVEAIKSSSIVVLIYSAHSNHSHQVLREMERAVQINIPIIPYLIEDEPLSKSMSYFLGATHWLKAMNLSPEKRTQLLVTAVNGRLKSKARDLHPTGFLLPTPPILKKTYWLGIILAPVFTVLILIINPDFMEDAFVFVGFLAAFGIPYGVYGLLWGRSAWAGSVFVGFIALMVVFFLALVVFPLL